MDLSDFTYGIEEEFFLVHARTGNAAVRVPKRLLARAEKALGNAVTREVFQSQIEIRSSILRTTAEAREEMSRLRTTLAEVAESAGLGLLAAGTHPLAAWREQLISDTPRHDRLVEDYQIVGRRNLFCGMHVHVGIPAGVDRIDVMNRAMRWLPLFLALSTSSPFWNRQRTGLLSYRQAAYDEWPRSGIPDFFTGEEEYRACTQFLATSGIIKDPSFLWWAIRPSARFPTLELRIADSCTRLDDTLALASLFRCLVATLVREPLVGAVRSNLTRFVIDENRWRAKRDGTSAIFIDDRDGTATSCADELKALLHLVHPVAVELGCGSELKRLRTIVAGGTSAHEQLRIYRERREAGASRLDALHPVVRWLMNATRVVGLAEDATLYA